MKPSTSEQGEEGAGGEMLNETEQFIEKIEAVEKDRKESQSSVAVADTPDIEIVEVTETASIAESSGVEIFVQRPSVTENDVEDDVKSIKSVKEDLENTKEDVDEDSKSIKSMTEEEDTRSIKSIKSITQSVREEDNISLKLDKEEDTQSVKSIRSIKSTNVEADTTSIKSVKDEDTQSVKSITSIKSSADDDTRSIKSFSEKVPDEDSISIFAGLGEDTKVDYQAGEKVSEFVLYKKLGDDEDDIVGNYQIVDQGVIVSKKNADNISVLSFAVTEAGDNASLRSVTIEKKDEDDDEEDDGGVDDDCDGDSVKTLTEGEEKEVRVDVTNGVVYTNGVADDRDEIEIHPDDQDDQTELDEYRSTQDTEEDRESIKSYSIHGDYILSLHQRVGTDNEKKAPVPKPRGGSVKAKDVDSEVGSESVKSVAFVEEIQENNVSHEETAFASNYEEERSRVDFDTVVKEAMHRNRGASEKTGVDALEREEGEDRPNIAALLAWAKATKDPNQTRTFVVRKRGGEEDTPPPQRQHSFNVSDDFEVIIQEKEKPVTQTAENGVTKISTSKKTFEVSQRASTFEVSLRAPVGAKNLTVQFSGSQEKCDSIK